MPSTKTIKSKRKKVKGTGKRKVSSLRKENEVIAIVCADIHLSLNAPIWRSAEPDWFAAMKRPLSEIKKLQKKYDCPVLCAGDIFDRWNSPPELINFAINNLPANMHCIPGQHDLPLHNYEDIRRSAYWTLVAAGKINNLAYMLTCLPKERKIILNGFPFGCEIKNTDDIDEDISFPAIPKIALVHEYIWIDGKAYPNAPEENRLSRNASKFIDGKWKGYDLVIYGDNHKGFKYQFSNCKTQFFNCGTLMRRKSDEIDYKPQVGLIYSDGSVISHYLDTSEDKHLDTVELKKQDSLDMKSFIQELEKLGDTDLDFSEAMKQYLKKNKININICNIIMGAMNL